MIVVINLPASKEYNILIMSSMCELLNLWAHIGFNVFIKFEWCYITVIGQVETCIRPKQIVNLPQTILAIFDCVSILFWDKSAALVYIFYCLDTAGNV